VAFLDGLYYKPDLLCISETWVLPSICGAFNNLNGHNFVSCCRQSDIKIFDKIITCGTIYRSPLSDAHHNEQFLNSLKSCLQNLSQKWHCLIAGDFKYNLAQSDNLNVSNFVELMFDTGNSYIPVINKPTCISRSSASIIRL